jgi:hypothetical protein
LGGGDLTPFRPVAIVLQMQACQTTRACHYCISESLSVN